MEEELETVNPEAPQSPIVPIRVETALSPYPLHRLSRKGNIKIELDPAKHNNTTWKVSYNSEYGQPGPLAYKLDTLIISRRIEEARRPIPRILKLGSLSDICRELNLADSGKNRTAIRNALFQNAFSGINTRTQYRSLEGKETTLEAAFTRYSIILTGEKLPDGRKADGVYIVLNDVFISVINGAMTRPLDYDYLKSLSPAPQRFYELLSYQIYHTLKYDRARAKLDYSDLCERAPLTRHLDWNSVRSQMSKIHAPHKQSGYILKVDYQQTTDAKGQPDWSMYYLPGPKARDEYRTFVKKGGAMRTVEIEPPSETPLLNVITTSPLVLELTQLGVTTNRAEQLVTTYPEERIAAQIERLNWLLTKKSNKITDPAAYLVMAIQQDYAAPKGFISKAERQQRELAKQAKEKQEADTRRLERENDAREKQERQAIKDYWESLPPDQQAELEAKALAVAPADLKGSAKNPANAFVLRLHRDQYIRDLLQGQRQ